MSDKTKKHAGGRPALGKVKLTCHVKPETREALGEHPGAAIDSIVARIDAGEFEVVDAEGNKTTFVLSKVQRIFLDRKGKEWK
jgi:predicted GTPase